MRRVHDLGLCSRACDHKLPVADEVALCRAWIRRNAHHLKSFNARAFSYALKHRVEEAEGAYVSNGAFVTAALLEGYGAKAYEGDGLGAYFNMGFRKPARGVGIARSARRNVDARQVRQ